MDATGDQWVLYESARTRVVRQPAGDPHGSVIRKDVAGTDASQRLRHERTILERLKGVPGVSQLLGASGNSLFLRDDGGQPPGAGPLPLDQLLDLAPALAGVTARVHAHGVIHHDICPANVILCRGGPLLVDFDLATVCTGTPAAFPHPGQVLGTPAYLAPECTGRTGRPIDHRADLYSLGATLYCLATGRPPFGDGTNLMPLVHDHFARLPRPPLEHDSQLPPMLSAAILRLLAKDPDQRYQSAHGLAFDLQQIHDDPHTPFRLGLRDFPQRLTAPARLIGRDREVAALTEAFAAVRNATPGAPRSRPGSAPAVLISGAPGIGKSRLIDELRPLVAAAGGWLISGTFDRHRHDAVGDAVVQAIRLLGRFVLADSEAEVALACDRLRAVLGDRIGLLTAVAPEFAVLLGATTDPPGEDARTAQSQRVQVGLDVLRTLARPDRPIVLAIDDLQWADSTPLALVDTLISGGNPPSTLLVATYRDSEVGPSHPLAAARDRWRQLASPPTELTVSGLTPEGCAQLVAAMLRMPVDSAAVLAATVCGHTGGNPFDVVELVNEVRRGGGVVLGVDGWSWDTASIRRIAGRHDVSEVLTARLEGLPELTCELLSTVAVLGGGEVPTDLLQHASASSGAELENALWPAVEEGLVMWSGPPERAVGFDHERVREAVLHRLEPDRASEIRLGVARRLALVPDEVVSAATHYLSVLDLIDDPQERASVAVLCREAAARSRLLSNYTAVDKFLAVAESVLGRDSALATERHAALFGQGRLEEADELYGWIDARISDPIDRAPATALQVTSLIGRGDPGAGVALGVAALRELGVVEPPPEALGAAVDRGLARVREWLVNGSTLADLARAPVTEPRLSAIAAICNSTMPAAFFSDPTTMGWLVGECVGLWLEYGPVAELLGPVSHLGFVASVLRDDYRTGRDALSRLLQIGEARLFEPGTSQARFLYALGSAHWFLRPEQTLEHARQARDGLIQGGDLSNACYTYYALLPLLLECAPRVEDIRAEAEAAIAFCGRTSNGHAAQAFAAYRDLALELLCEATGPSRQHRGDIEGNPTAAANAHSTTAILAALFDRPAALAAHTAALMELLPFVHATPVTMTAHLLRAIALAGSHDGAAERTACLNWMAGRVADAPHNFAHLHDLADAEHHRVTGRYGAALRAYDAALRAVAGRPGWHHPYIAERAGRFHLARGMGHTGGLLIAEAHDRYANWGAVAKVAQLEREFSGLGRSSTISGGSAGATMNFTADAIDLHGILAASQALSSEVSAVRLHERVTAVLSAMTGATSVNVLVWSDRSGKWVVPVRGGDPSATLEDVGADGSLPLSAIRYAERSGQPLLVEDACVDERFSADPYVSGLAHCSLLVLPILYRGARQALVVLANTLSRGAFTADRMGGVRLVAGQLAVSIANVRLYASLEDKVAERTAQLTEANRQLEQLSRTDGLTGLANRRSLDDVLEAEWRRGIRAGTPLALAMLDVDHFKQYNDHYGHALGDACLREVAAAVRGSVRITDVPARYGGEEFAVILPDTDNDGARLVAERTRVAIEALRLPHAGTPTGFVTASVGVAALAPSRDRTVRQLVEAADAQLYAAKRSGRNRVGG
ncbi:diguanylate cyclase [Cryptosporangium sp. NPDC048952]|uniref:diguanylate cyclase n=1 Tax=Cryptosporangium sp. NPDC048952 TaxID=3363961 RepID=UPI003718A497